MAAQRDVTPVDLTFHIEVEGRLPELCSSFQIATVQGELDPHSDILSRPVLCGRATDRTVMPVMPLMVKL